MNDLIIKTLCLFLLSLYPTVGLKSQGKSVPQLDSLQYKLVKATEDPSVPGISLIIIKSDTLLFAGSSGVKNLKTKERLNPSDKMHIGSCTKAMTGYLGAVMVEKRLLDWNTTVVEVFPEIEHEIAPIYTKTTLSSLLSHHAGVIPFENLEDWIALEKQLEFKDKSIIKSRYEFTKWALQKEPVKLGSIAGKEDFIYSNAGYIVAAAMIERVAGRSWEKLMEQYIFKPLGIDAVIGWPAQIEASETWGHWWNADSTRLIPAEPNGDWFMPDYGDPAGDISMSPFDYGKWLQKNLIGLKGKDGDFSKAFYEYLHYANINHSYYSIGWGSWDDTGLRYSSHSGSARTFYCHVTIIRELDLAVAGMTNADTEQSRAAVKKLIYNYLDSVIDN